MPFSGDRRPRQRSPNISSFFSDKDGFVEGGAESYRYPPGSEA